MRVWKPEGCLTYWYDFTLPGQPRVRKDSKQTNQNLAELEASDAFAKARNAGVEVLTHKAPVLEVFAVEFIQWVEATHSLGKDGKDYYRNGWRMLEKTAVAKMKMDQITNHDLDVAEFPSWGTQSSANNAIKTLRRMYTKAKELKKYFGERPQFKLRKEWARAIKMTVDDARKIDANWEPGEASQNSRDIFRVLCSTGMRPKECFEMRWEFVDFDREVYHNEKGKTKSAQREVALNFPPFKCVDILRDRHERMGCPSEGWVFPGSAECGHMVTITKPFTKARNRAKLPSKMVLYTARHGACTAIAGVSTMKESMQLMGHTDIETALRYQHPDHKGIGDRLWAKMKTQADEKEAQKMGVKL